MYRAYDNVQGYPIIDVDGKLWDNSGSSLLKLSNKKKFNTYRPAKGKLPPIKKIILRTDRSLIVLTIDGIVIDIPFNYRMCENVVDAHYANMREIIMIDDQGRLTSYDLIRHTIKSNYQCGLSHIAVVPVDRDNQCYNLLRMYTNGLLRLQSETIKIAPVGDVRNNIIFLKDGTLIPLIKAEFVRVRYSSRHPYNEYKITLNVNEVEDCLLDALFDGRDIVYINDNRKLMRKNLDDGKTTTVEINFIPNRLLFIRGIPTIEDVQGEAYKLEDMTPLNLGFKLRGYEIRRLNLKNAASN